MFSIELPKEIDQRLEALAKQTGKSKTHHALQAIVEHLDELEDIRHAEETLKRVQSGEEETFSLEDVERGLGLED